MKQKFNDIGRCLICLQNPCQCKKSSSESTLTLLTKRIQELCPELPFMGIVDIYLENVLLALGKKEGEWHITVWGNGIAKIDKDIEWKLNEGLSKQPTQTLEALYNILK